MNQKIKRGKEKTREGTILKQPQDNIFYKLMVQNKLKNSFCAFLKKKKTALQCFKVEDRSQIYFSQ